MIRIALSLLLYASLTAAWAAPPEEVQTLVAAFEKEVGAGMASAAYRETAEREVLNLAGKNKDFSTPQYAVFVDRNPAVQTGSIVYVDVAAKNVVVIGVFPVSTGNSHRRGFFETPVGVFRNSAENMNYRALGTKKQQGLAGARGQELAGMGFRLARNETPFRLAVPDPPVDACNRPQFRRTSARESRLQRVRAHSGQGQRFSGPARHHRRPV